MAKKKAKAHLLPPKKGKGPPHSHMMGKAERDMPPGMLTGRPRTKGK